MKTRMEMVAEFYEAAGVNHPEETHIKLIREELKEFLAATEAFLKEAADLEYVCVGAILDDIGVNDVGTTLREEMRRAADVTDWIPRYILNEAFRRVHESNMSKLVDNLRDPDTGKILKGPSYKAPDLSDII